MSIFKFKKFDIEQSDAVHKVGTDVMLLGALVTCDAPQYVLDVGTGTGVLALMLAQKFQSAQIIGLDIDPTAVSLAELNFKKSFFLNRFEAVCQNFLSYTPSIKFDLIVSNPPYYKTQMYPEKLESRQAKHEDTMPILDMLQHSAKLLSETGAFWLLLPSIRAEELKVSHHKSGLTISLIHEIVIYGKPNRPIRSILVFSKDTTKLKNLIHGLTIRDEEGTYTEEYKLLTSEFHYNKL